MRFKETDTNSEIFGVDGGGPITSITEPVREEDVIDIKVEEIPRIQPFGEHVQPGKEVILPRVNTSRLGRSAVPQLESGSSKE